MPADDNCESWRDVKNRAPPSSSNKRMSSEGLESERGSDSDDDDTNAAATAAPAAKTSNKKARCAPSTSDSLAIRSACSDARKEAKVR
jgi:hypothetical protein